MVQIIEENRNPGFRERLLSGLGMAAQQGSQMIPQMLMGKQQGDAIKKLTGQEVQGLSPELQKVVLEKHYGAHATKQAEKHNAMQLGLQTIDQMRSLISSAGPSNYVSGLFGGETTKNRAQLEALGRSLIPLVAAGVPIRNQREFDEYRKVITNPNSRQAELEGALDGLQGLFERSLSQSDVGEKPSSQTAKVKFNPAHPEHKAKATQLHKRLKDKEKVRKELEREFEF